MILSATHEEMMKMPGSIRPLLTDIDLEKITGRSRSCWQKDRISGGEDMLPFVRIGRLIRYRPEDVEAWIARNIRSNTSAPK